MSVRNLGIVIFEKQYYRLFDGLCMGIDYSITSIRVVTALLEYLDFLSARPVAITSNQVLTSLSLKSIQALVSSS